MRFDNGELFKVVEIGHKAIDVVRIVGLVEHEEAHGIWAPQDQTIYIDSELTGADLMETILHECVHVCSDFAALELNEQTVCTLSFLLAQMLYNNFDECSEEDPVQDASDSDDSTGDGGKATINPEDIPWE